MKARVYKRGGATYYFFYCPGCKETHQINDTWDFNGDTEKPTFTPSILATRPANPNAGKGFEEYRKEKLCHSYVTDGQIQFLGDSLHELAGQTVPLPDCPKQIFAGDK